MALTSKQEKGLKITLEKFKNKEKYIIISGYAGTGKSFLIKHIIDALGVYPEKVAYATYCGKAAEVLRKRGNPNATTLHKLLYESKPRRSGGFYHYPRTHLDFKVIVVDEASMVPQNMIDLLLRHHIFIIFCGDPFQLEVIDKKEQNTLLNKPDIFLDEIMRQEAESEIIRLTMDIRANKPLQKFIGKEVIVCGRNDLNDRHLLWADQVICATNKTRLALNNKIRNITGHITDIPDDGEKLICLRNDWDRFKSPLVNGMTGTIHNIFESYINLPTFFESFAVDKIPLLCGTFINDENETFSVVEFDKSLITKGEKTLTWEDEFKIIKNKKKYHIELPVELTYGYAITGWKAQGSEWDKVLVIEENFPFDQLEHQRFLYTCATRSIKKLIVVMNK